MGTEVSVASVVYNLAGEEINRPNYLKSLVIRNVLSGTKNSISNSLNSGYLNGPAIHLRSFYRWAKNPNNYGEIGMPIGALESSGTVKAEIISPYIEVGVDEVAFVQSAVLESANPVYWAEQWIFINRPDDYGSAWTSKYDPLTGDITIKFGEDSEETFTPENFVPGARYLYAYYMPVSEGTIYGDSQLFIYRIGSGHTELDELVSAAVTHGEFFPFIPFRLNTKFVSESYLPTVYPQVRKAFRKATGGKLEDMIEQLEKQPKDLKKIDYGYVMFGVSLNTIEPVAKEYIYRFFNNLRLKQKGNATSFNDWLTQNAEDLDTAEAWNDWLDDQIGPPPSQPTFWTEAKNELRVQGNPSSDVKTRYDMRLKWRYISSHGGSGVSKPGVKVGEIWLQHAGTQEFFQSGTRGRDGVRFIRKVGETHTMRIYWQRSANVYTYLNIVGMEHENNVYKGNVVKINTKKALSDTEESGFIVPLHMDTFKEMSLMNASQLSTSCMYAVFNCYEENKTKWYQSGIFKIFLVIVIAITSVVLTGGAGIGLLGTHLAVGSALGLTGMTAAIVGSVVNALAALLLATLLEKALSGWGILGAVISALIMVVVGNVASVFNTPGSLAVNWGQLLRADNLLTFTDALGRGVTNMLRNETMSLQQDWANFQEKTKQEVAKIQQAYFDEFGYGAGAIDPFMFVDGTSGPLNESSDTFLHRTLMTGSDIAEMSTELLYGFPEYSLKLPDAFT